MKILVIEDEPGMRDNIVQSLQKEMYIVETANDYFTAREKLGVYDYDCILLDIGLPGGSGFDILKELKKDGKEGGLTRRPGVEVPGLTCGGLLKRIRILLAGCYDDWQWLYFVR